MMKKAMKKCLARALALAVVASMTCSYALAASFDDLQNAIDGNTSAGTQITDSGREDHYGYGVKNEETGNYGVESWKGDDGSHNVQLNESVSREDGKEDGVVVGKEDGNVSIDLNGNDITSDNYNPEAGTAANGTPGEGGEYGSVIEVKDDASLTIKDTSSDRAEEQGTISGGFGIYDGGGGILVDGGTLNMEGGNISDNASYSGGGGVGVKNDGEFNMSGGTISDNVGGGVTVKGESEFNMSGGEIKDNSGSGVQVDDSEFTMDGGSISGNTAGEGGGVYIGNGGSFTMNDGDISNNTANNGGGVTVNDWSTWDQSDFTMNGGGISGNTANNYGGGVYAPGKSDVTINNGTISDNKANLDGGGVHASNLTMNGGTVSGNEAGKGGGGITVDNFTMNGGTVEKNVARDGEGGGIHINGNAEITGKNGNVYIRDNRTETRKDLGGGGIYVATNGRLVLTNVVVSNNTAALNGGGLAACQTGRTLVYATNGGAFFDNHGLGGQDFSGWTDEQWNVFFDDLSKQQLNTNCDGGSVWKNAQSTWSVEQKKLFVTAAQDIFTASLGGYSDYNAGAVVGNIMLGSNKPLGDQLTPEQIEEVAKHLANWTGYSVTIEDSNRLNDVGEGNNGVIFGDRFLVLTAHPTEEARQAAMNAGRVFISGNESLYTHGGGIANNGTLIIGQEVNVNEGISSVPSTGLNKDWVDADGNEIELKGGEFSFTMTGGLEGEESKSVTVKNDRDGNASFDFFGEGFFTRPGTYVFTLSEVVDEELAKLGLTYDKSQYKVTIIIDEETTSETIGETTITVKSLVLNDMVIERIKDADGRPLENPEAVDSIQFVNTGKPTKPEQPEESGEPKEDPREEPGEDPREEPEEPTTDIPKEDVPLAEEPTVEIPEEEVPLAEIPEEEVEIPDEDVPLADVPKTGDISLMWYLTALLSACGLAFLGLRKKNRS